MKLIHTFSVGLFVILGLFACTNNLEENPLNVDNIKDLIELSNEELISVSFDNARELNEAEVFELIEEFQKANDKTFSTRGYESNSSLSIKDKYYVTTSNTSSSSRSTDSNSINVPIYEVSISNGIYQGLAIASGDERVPSVLAYIPHVSDEEGLIESGAKALIDISKESLLIDLLKMKSIRDSLKILTIEKISIALGLEANEITEEVIATKTYIKDGDEILTRAQPIQSGKIPTQILSYTGPLLETQWNQGSPYNSKLIKGYVYNSTNYTNVPAGCAVIAVAQLFAHCEPSMTISGLNMDWNLLKEKRTISNSDSQAKRDMIAILVSEIYAQTLTGLSYNEAGYIDGSGSSWINYVPYMNRFLASDAHQIYDADKVYNSLNLLRPILIRGEGHAFIIDGYIICKKSTRILLQSYDIYWHADLGWGDTNTGYYKINQDTNAHFETGSNTYHTENLYIVPNIRKK